jgi:hypothetical protein
MFLATAYIGLVGQYFTLITYVSIDQKFHCFTSVPQLCKEYFLLLLLLHLEFNSVYCLVMQLNLVFHELQHFYRT